MLLRKTPNTVSGNAIIIIIADNVSGLTFPISF